jgi:hypothetical protein
LSSCLLQQKRLPQTNNDDLLLWRAFPRNTRLTFCLSFQKKESKYNPMAGHHVPRSRALPREELPFCRLDGPIYLYIFGSLYSWWGSDPEKEVPAGCPGHPNVFACPRLESHSVLPTGAGYNCCTHTLRSLSRQIQAFVNLFAKKCVSCACSVKSTSVHRPGFCLEFLRFRVCCYRPLTLVDSPFGIGVKLLEGGRLGPK